MKYSAPLYINEIIAKTKEDFELLLDCICVGKDGVYLVDFNKFIPVPRHIRVASRYLYNDLIKVAADYIMEHYNIEMDFLTTELVKEYIKDIPNKSGNYTEEIIEDIVDMSQEYSKILDFKDKFKNNSKDYLKLGVAAIDSLFVDGCFTVSQWKRTYWGTEYNASDSSINKEKLSIRWTSIGDPDTEMLDKIYGRLGIELYYRYSDIEPMKIAAEILYPPRSKSTIARPDVALYMDKKERGLYDICGALGMAGGYVWDPLKGEIIDTSKLSVKEIERMEFPKQTEMRKNFDLSFEERTELFVKTTLEDLAKTSSTWEI